MKRKIDLYILSLGVLFAFIIILTVNIPELFCENFTFHWFKKLFFDNMVSLIFLLFLLYCVIAYYGFNFALKGATDIPFEIKKIEGINYEHLTFLVTYVIPLISFDFGSIRQLVVLGLLLVVVGIIYIRTDLFYANPSLILLGFHIYHADGCFKTGDREGLILICRGHLSVGEKVEYIKLDQRIYYVKKVLG